MPPVIEALDKRDETKKNQPQSGSNHFDVIVLGAGFSGIGAAIKLLENGISNFVVLEKAGEIGGVWRENTYPGCACDIPASLYSYSFAANPHWSKLFAGQAEIKDYLKATAERYRVMPHVRLNHELIKAHWDNDGKQWLLETNAGHYSANFAIAACGPMHEPIIPDIRGISKFNGKIFHSAQWDHNYDLSNKRVAVIGTGASAIQFVPKIQSQVKSLSLFQRTPHWVLPKLDLAMPRWLQTVFKTVPLPQKILRAILYANFEVLNSGFRYPRIMKHFQRLAQHNIHSAIKDPELRKKVTPDYIIGCKRILQSNDWYPAINKPNVEVIHSAVCEIDGNKVIAADGTSCEVDAIILGTGFEITAPPIAKRIYGRSGIAIADIWHGSPIGYKGTMVDDCPNAFLMFGPNLAINSSAFVIIEAQLNYIMDALNKVRRNNITTIDIDPSIMAVFNNKVQHALQNTVWNSGGCSSYFIDRNGRNSTAWPWSTFHMRNQLSKFDLQNYIVNEQIKKDFRPNNQVKKKPQVTATAVDA